MREPAFWWRADRLTAGLLAPLAALYAAVATSRMQRPGPSAGVPVVCIGNLTLGGAGKTPTAIAVTQLLTTAGCKPFVLSRGYGGRLPGPVRVEATVHSASDVGDEPLLLARVAPTIVARDRLAGAAFGFVRGLCVAAAATSVLLVAVPKPVPDFVRESAILPYALGAADFASALAPAALKKAVSNSIGEVKKSWNEEVDKAKRRAEKAFDAEPAAKQEVEIVPPKAKAKKKLTAPPKAVKQ